jgi:PQQ-dependent catabolism-associated CXXCW motif protein
VRSRHRIALIFPCMISVFGASAGDAPPEPDSYRMGDYRAPTPATLKGARVLSTDEAHKLWLDGAAVFVDVLPQAPRPANLPPEVVWRDKPRYDIPGSVWLPDTGYGDLPHSMEAYLRAGLRKASGDDATKTIVFYCQRDCWMSWNAAKRALALGRYSVDWYPEGADGWSAEGFPLEARRPEPRP